MIAVRFVSILLGLILVPVLTIAAGQAEVQVDGPTTSERPLDTVISGSMAYFPTRPSMRESMERMALEIEDNGVARLSIVTVVLDQLETALNLGTLRVFNSLFRTEAYAAAIETTDCRFANHLVWDALIQADPFVQAFRHDDFFNRLLKRDIFQTHFPELAACLYAREAATRDRLIVNFSTQHAEGNGLTETGVLVRPFVFHHSWASAAGTIHGRRDINFVELGDMAVGLRAPDYAPAGVLLVELALELDSLDLHNALLTMLLLRANETWPQDDRPLPVERRRIAELLDEVFPRLSIDELAYAQSCFMTGEPADRLFLGFESVVLEEQTQLCAQSGPNAQ